MPRTSRIAVGGEVYHVINRANGRMTIFTTKEDYKLFEQHGRLLHQLQYEMCEALIYYDTLILI
jgi:REP element-mobilizing transposase RayT